jgi:hypothetical protein
MYFKKDLKRYVKIKKNKILKKGPATAKFKTLHIFIEPFQQQ